MTDKMTTEEAFVKTLQSHGIEHALARDLEDQLEAANGRIAELERALGALKYWFDTDPEVLDAMSADELADHTRQAALIEAVLITDDEASALEAVKREAWNAAIEEVCDFMGDPHGIGDSFYIPHILALKRGPS